MLMLFSTVRADTLFLDRISLPVVQTISLSTTIKGKKKVNTSLVFQDVNQ